MDAILAERASRYPETAGSLFAFQTNLSILFGAVGALANLAEQSEHEAIGELEELLDEWHASTPWMNVEQQVETS